MSGNNSHWYRHSNGVTEPCYELPRKNGGGTKAVTLREARELGLLPSVTTVLQMIAKPELTNWLISQGIYSALTLPRWEGESEDEFIKRVIEDADQQSQKARDFGISIHDALEAYLVGGSAPAPELEPFLKDTFSWIDFNIEKVVTAESYVGCPVTGIAGRLDLDCITTMWGPAIIDFKTQRVREKPAFYPEFALQLAAYARMRMAGADIKLHCEKWPTLVSVVIDSGKPGPPHIKVWDDPERYWKLFQCAYELWVWKNSYDPRCHTKT